MSGFLVEMRGEVREVYYVQAISEDEARAHWADGELVLSEASSMEFHGIEPDGFHPDAA